MAANFLSSLLTYWGYKHQAHIEVGIEESSLSLINRNRQALRQEDKPLEGRDGCLAPGAGRCATTVVRILSVVLRGRSWERWGLPFSGSPANQRSPAPRGPRPSRYGTQSPRPLPAALWPSGRLGPF